MNLLPAMNLNMHDNNLSTQDVIDAIYSDDDDHFDVDDSDEPFMEGSDDDFSDLIRR